MNNEKVTSFEIIKAFVRGCWNEDKTGEYKEYIKSEYNGEDKSIWNCYYLLNQILRQVSVPEKNKYVSVEAKKLWDAIGPVCKGNSSNDINDYYYHEKIIATKDGAEIFEYKGSSNKPISETPRRLKKGDSFIFRDVFHVEHIVPITMIIEELVELDKKNELTDKKLNDILNLICVCRITKKEDRSIKEKYNRSLDLNDVFEKVYKSQNINIVGR